MSNSNWSRPWEGVVSDDLTSALESISLRRTYMTGDVVYRRGDVNRDMFGVVTGVVRMMFTSPDGRELIAGLYTPGTWFGEVSVFDHGPRPTDAVVMQDAELLIAPAARVSELLDSNPLLYRELARVVCGKLRVAFDFVEDTFMPMAVRVARRLLDLCETHGVPVTEGLMIDLRLSQVDLAQMLGLARQSINREVKALEAAGLIGQMGGRIFVRNQPGLQRWLEDQIAQAGG